jgi:hypothetical protein
MKTSELIELLGNDALTPRPGEAYRRLGRALALGGAITLALVVLWLRCQPLLVAAGQMWFWMKAAFTVLLAACGVVLVRRLATPGASLKAAPWLVPGIIAVMAGLGAWELAIAPRALRPGLWFGQTWQVCSPLILLLALPIYLALVVAVRGLAPTRLTVTGAAIGFAAGALAAALYGLHCPEQGAAFVATWYSLGIAASTALGALTGRWLLRW